MAASENEGAMVSFSTQSASTESDPSSKEPVPRPMDLPQIEGLDLQACHHSDRCGGDFFDGIIAGFRVIFLLTDISGQQPETHAIASEMQNVFRKRAKDLFEASEANESESIAALTRDVNQALIDAAGGVRFAPAFLGCFNLTLGTLTYHNAGNLSALFRDAEGTRILGLGGIPLGLFTHATYEPAFLAFEPRAKLLLMTKGVTERRQGKSEFGLERAKLILENSTTDSAREICEAVLNEAREFGNHRHPLNLQNNDDLTAIVLVRSGKAAAQVSEA